MIVNYEENELGTMAPELWDLNFEHEEEILEHIDAGTIVSLPVPSEVDPNSAVRWGQASFAGPNHDVLVCDVAGHVRFYHFERSKDPKSPLKVREISDAKAISEQDFADFFHPIFTWGDAASQPIMAATDLDGKGNICVWTVPDDRKATSWVRTETRVESSNFKERTRFESRCLLPEKQQPESLGRVEFRRL
ncbi:hypothetical protein SCHPADRAFT_674669 [Schizopora paradoxa]|uniref:Uncharacterized protein n=1 Tax=Schizopora paradoxa TaxID=27342 RepID=A0A0H2R4W2_9AGAM|nr:hypothetical protein SCHPADRAFT_674669 [Schizopora paradoxa]